MGFKVVTKYDTAHPHENADITDIVKCIERYEKQAEREPIPGVKAWYKGYGKHLVEKYKLHQNKTNRTEKERPASTSGGLILTQAKMTRSPRNQTTTNQSFHTQDHSNTV